VLLDVMYDIGWLHRYVPFDVSEGTLRETCHAIAIEYPGVDVTGVVGDFRRHLAKIPTEGRRMFAFLGGTIGNFRPIERAEFLTQLAATMRPGDSLIVGTDLVKDRQRLVAAYDDAAGVTAAFNKNVLAVLNRDLGADFDPDAFDHVARFDENEEWIEMRLRARHALTVDVPRLGLTLEFEPGEDLWTEVSAKFRPGRFDEELRENGLTPVATLSDAAGDYALSVSVR
jgi:L-histidine N-alpha-methyltransferase